MRRIKIGVKLFETNTPDQYLLGTPKNFIRISTPAQKALALEIAKGRSDCQILEESGVDSQALEKIFSELEAATLIDSEESSLKVSHRFISKVEDRVEKSKKGFVDAALLQLQSRAMPELTQSRWISGVRDGGINSLTARQNYLVEISGENRVATILYSLLLVSGFSQVRFAPESRNRKPQIGDGDIGVIDIGPSEIGKSFRKHCESLRKELSLFPLDRDHNYLDELSTPELRVHCGDSDPEKLSQWMSTSQNFLLIPNPQGDIAEIGPLVIPGKSPCIRCLLLVARDQNRAQQYLDFAASSEGEYPHIAAHFIASIAASLIASYFDSASQDKYDQELVGTVLTVDYQSLSRIKSAAIARHPLCGCAFT
jgi:hypothetical protein